MAGGWVGGGYARGLVGAPRLTLDPSLAYVACRFFVNRCGDSYPFLPDPEGGRDGSFTF